MHVVKNIYHYSTLLANKNSRMKWSLPSSDLFTAVSASSPAHLCSCDMNSTAVRGAIHARAIYLLCICALGSAWQKPYQKRERSVKSGADVLFSNCWPGDDLIFVRIVMFNSWRYLIDFRDSSGDEDRSSMRRCHCARKSHLFNTTIDKNTLFSLPMKV